jgi:hypothetical protein
MDFVDEENIAMLEAGECGDKIRAFGESGAGLEHDAGAHLFGDDMGEGGFAEAGWAVEQEMFQRFAAALSGLECDAQAFDEFFLAHELADLARAQREVELLLLRTLCA